MIETRDKAPTMETPEWARTVEVSKELWRVVDARGRAIGHVRAHRDGSAWRFSAERYSAHTRSFRRFGDFWSAREALECLRYLR
jgi:hypothetical protein